MDLKLRNKVALVAALVCFISAPCWSKGVKGFVTRSGSHLMLNGKPFRFAGANMDNLVIASDKFSNGNPDSGQKPEADVTVSDQYYPSKYAIDDAFETERQMGGKVARIWCGGSEGFPLAVEPTLGQFNERALQQLDYVVKSAGDHGIRAEIVLVVAQQYYLGGKCVFEDWRNGASFYEEPVVSDFEQYIATIINRKNSYTHKLYKDDPAIFGWETDNEIRDSPVEWENQICSYIKTLDPNHLVINGDDQNFTPDRLAEPDADMFVKHYYFWGQHWNLVSDAKIVTDAGKVFMLEEYGWDRTNFQSTEELQAGLAEIENDPDVCGDMFWALRGHISPGKYFPVCGEGGEWWELYYDGITTSSNEANDMHERALILQAHGLKMAKM